MPKTSFIIASVIAESVSAEELALSNTIELTGYSANQLPSNSGTAIINTAFGATSIGSSSVSATLVKNYSLGGTSIGSSTISNYLNRITGLDSTAAGSSTVESNIFVGGIYGIDMYLEVDGAPVFNNDDDLAANNPGTYTVNVIRRLGGTKSTIIPPGTAAVKWGVIDGAASSYTGGMILTSDATLSPYIDIFTVNADGTPAPWEAGALVPRVRIGNIAGVLGLGSDEWGMAAGTDLSDTTTAARYIIASEKQLTLHNIDLKLYAGALLTVDITNAGDVKFGSNVSATATTTFRHVIAGDATNGDVIIGNAGAAHLTWDMSAGSLYLYNNTAPTIQLTSTGNVLIGTNVGAAATTSLAVFTGNGQVYNSETVNDGDILIGDNSTGTPKANIFWDKSAGTLNFRGGTTIQAYINTTGSIVFGAGHGVLTSSGMTLDGTQTSYQTYSSIRWMSTTDPPSGTESARVAGGTWYLGNAHELDLIANPTPAVGSTSKVEMASYGKSASGAGSTQIRSMIYAIANHTTKSSLIRLDSYIDPCTTGVQSAGIELYTLPSSSEVHIWAGASDKITIYDVGKVIVWDDLVVGNGLYVGSSGGTAVDDCIIADGSGTFKAGLNVGSSTGAGTGAILASASVTAPALVGSTTVTATKLCIGTTATASRQAIQEGTASVNFADTGTWHTVATVDCGASGYAGGVIRVVFGGVQWGVGYAYAVHEGTFYNSAGTVTVNAANWSGAVQAVMQVIAQSEYVVVQMKSNSGASKVEGQIAVQVMGSSDEARNFILNMYGYIN